MGLWVLWRTPASAWLFLVHDPAGFIDGLRPPFLRGLGLKALAAATWAASLNSSVQRWRLEPSTPWPAGPRSLAVETDAGPILVIARGPGDHGWVGAAGAAPGVPGLLRLPGPPERFEIHRQDGAPDAPLWIGPWNRWRIYRHARRAGLGAAEALRAAWRPSGRRFKGDEQDYGVTAVAYRAWRGEPAAAPKTDAHWAVVAGAWSQARPVPLDALSDATAIIFTEEGDALAPGAQVAMAEALADPSVSLIYGDEDHLDAEGRRGDPVFRTAFDAVRFAQQDYIGACLGLRAGRLRALQSAPSAEGLVARIAAEDGPSAVRHIPHILRHRPAGAAPPPPAVHTPRPALRDPAPRVRAIVPTRDGADLLRACAEGVLKRTDYPALELCIVDNGSTGPETLALLDVLGRDPRVRILRIDAPFHFAALNNAAAAESDADILAFLNDDTVVIEPGWLSEMVALAVRPELGAVGAKLFYPDGRIQHAGVTLGLGTQGVAGHPFRGAPGDMAGPQSMLRVAREVSAVTAACMVVERRKFEAVGGFDPAFRVAFNDVDLCLRLAGQGWRAVWTPHARLIHLESASRGPNVAPEKARRLAEEARAMRERWGDRLAEDPYYHPALSLKGERFNLAREQRNARPR